MKILIGFLALVAILVVVISLRPNEFKISRSISISAAPEIVFAQVNDHRRWEVWSPWSKLDPNMKKTFEGPQWGVGAIYKWAGNNQVGEGVSTIIESRPNELIKMKLDFMKPFKSSSDVEFAFVSEGTQTVVTWSMSGKNNFIGKAMSLFMDCQKMVGGQFDSGLAQLKNVVEKL